MLGSPEFIEDLQTVLEGNAREQAGLNSLKNHPHWREVIQVLEELKGEKWQSFVNRHKDGDATWRCIWGEREVG